jgi:transposase
MPSAVSLRNDFSSSELRRLAAASKNASQSRRLLSLAAVVDGMNRTEAARIGGMDRQTLRDWVHRFNDHGPDGLLDNWSKGSPPRLSPEQQTELAELVETGADGSFTAEHVTAFRDAHIAHGAHVHRTACAAFPPSPIPQPNAPTRSRSPPASALTGRPDRRFSGSIPRSPTSAPRSRPPTKRPRRNTYPIIPAPSVGPRTTAKTCAA